MPRAALPSPPRLVTATLLATLLATTLLTACHDHEHDEAIDPIAEGCPHLEFGPDIALDLAIDNPPITTVHTRYPIALAPTDDEGRYGGALAFTSMGGDYYFLLDRALDFNITDAEDEPVAALHSHTQPEACPVAAVAHHYLLPAGGYTLTFGPTDAASLQMAVHVPGTDHAHAH
jgi:hypothetical protein